MSCDCCSQPPSVSVSFVRQSKTSFCDDPCGAVGQIIGEPLFENFSSPCGTTLEAIYSNVYDVGIKFQSMYFAENWSKSCGGPEIQSNYYSNITNYNQNFNFETNQYFCISELDVINSSFLCCPGQARSSYRFFASPNFDCGALNRGTDWIDSTSSDALYQISKWGNSRLKKEARFKIIHTTPPSCYLKIFFRTKTLYYQIAENSSNYETEPTSVSYNESEILPYEWNGLAGSYYCLKNPNKYHNDTENIIGLIGSDTEQAGWTSCSVELSINEAAQVELNNWINSLEEDEAEFQSNLSLDSFDESWGKLAQQRASAMGPNLPRGIGGKIQKIVEYKFSTIKGYEPPWPNDPLIV